MSAMHASEPGNTPARVGGDRARSQRLRWVLPSVVGLVVVVLVLGGATMFAWMIDETRFDRPSEEFDALAAQIEDVPGVTGVEHERWVEAPFMSAPTSSMMVSVDEEGLPGLLDAACTTGYPEKIYWSFRVRTTAATLISLPADLDEPKLSGRRDLCPNFGLDAVGLVREIDKVVPGLGIQPTIWDDGTLTLVALGEESSRSEASVAGLLPLVARAGELLAAAGMQPTESLEINASNLGVVVEPGESDAYLALLAQLAEDYEVTSFWADGLGAPEDGIERVQIVVPDRQRVTIERLIRASGLHIADFPITVHPTLKKHDTPRRWRTDRSG